MCFLRDMFLKTSANIYLTNLFKSNPTGKQDSQILGFYVESSLMGHGSSCNNGHRFGQWRGNNNITLNVFVCVYTHMYIDIYIHTYICIHTHTMCVWVSGHSDFFLFVLKYAGETTRLAGFPGDYGIASHKLNYKFH